MSGTTQNGLNFCEIHTALGHVIGNVTGHVYSHIKGLFPKNFFKSERIATSIAIKDFENAMDGDYTELKKNKPYLSCRPRLLLDEPDFQLNSFNRLFGYNTMDGNVQVNNIINHSQVIFRDTDTNLFLLYTIKRMKMEFEMTYMFSTKMQEYNALGYMNTRMRIERPYYLENKYLEIQVPEVLIEQIAEHIGKQDTYSILKYLNTHSSLPFTYRLKTSLGQKKYFLLLPINITIEINKLPDESSGDKQGKITDDYMIEQLISVEFNYANTFFYFSEEKQNVIMTKGEFSEDEMSEDIDLIIPSVSISVPKHNEKGWCFKVSSEFMCDSHIINIEGVEMLKPDDIEFGQLFDKWFVDTIEESGKLGISRDSLIDLVVYENGIILEHSKDYSVDWKSYKLTILSPNEYSSYRLAIYTNNEFINKLKMSEEI